MSSCKLIFCFKSKFFFQILCSRRHLTFNSTKRKTPLPSNPMKKIKSSTDNITKKRKLPEANLTTINEPAKKKKKSSLKKNDANFNSTVDSECTKPPPTENLFKTLKLKWPKVSNLEQEKRTADMINTNFSKLSFEQKNKTKQVRKKKPLLEEWKCKRIDEYMTKCDKIIPPALEKSQKSLWESNTLVVVQKLSDEIIPPALETSDKHLSSDVCESKAGMVVQTLLDEVINSIYSQTSNENTDHAEDKNEFNLESCSKSLLDHTDDQFQICELTADFFESGISPTQDTSLITNTPESRGNSISLVKNTSSMINKPTIKTENSSSRLKTGCVSASTQKNTVVSEELVLQSSISPMECRNEVLKSITLKKSNSKYSCKGFFPRIQFSGHIKSQRNDCNNSKNLKKSKKAGNDVQVKESFNKQENKPKKIYSSSNYFKTESVGGENKVSIIDHYFSHLKKDFKNSSDIQKIDVGSSLNSSGEENKNDTNSYSPSSPEKKPLVELQFSMLPFCGF